MPEKIADGNAKSPALTIDPSRQFPWLDYAKVLLIVVACTVIATPVASFLHRRNLELIYLLGIVFVSSTSSRGPAIFGCLLSVTVYDYFFIPPAFSFSPPHEYAFTVAAMLVVSLLVSSMSSRLREAAHEAAGREQKEKTMNKFMRAISSTRTLAALAEVGAEQIRAAFGWRSIVCLCSAESQQLLLGHQLSSIEQELAQRAHRQKNTVYDTSGTSYVPLVSGQHSLGVLVICAKERSPWTQARKQMAQDFADQLTFGIERATGLETAEKAKLQVEGMKIRNALLSSVSHDLRTPLASIMGAASSILADSAHTQGAENRELLQSIENEADRLNKFLKNLLDMTRIESGAVQLKKEWQSLEESVGVALNRLRKQLQPFQVVTKMPEELPLALYDEQLIDQVLFNLLDNAAKYAPSGSEISVSGKVEEDGAITVKVSNIGCTLPPGAEARMFDKFYRGDANVAQYGAGLGLTICRGIMQAHGGQLWAERFGADSISICFTLPSQGKPPEIEAEDLTPVNSGQFKTGDEEVESQLQTLGTEKETEADRAQNGVEQGAPPLEAHEASKETQVDGAL